MTIHAFTETHLTPPAYINVSESDNRQTIVVTVRSNGVHGNSGSIHLSREELAKLAISIINYLGK